MGRFSDRTKKVSNEEIEAVCDEFNQKMETLRIRYEQYFIGAEKAAPSALRMDVARLMHDLETAFVKNTALKFRIQTSIQKFTSYSTYWNRTLREIEDGTYKRHLDRVKRQRTKTQETPVSPQFTSARQETVSNPAATQAVANEAEAFLASLGYSAPNTSNYQPNAQPGMVQQPAAVQPSGAQVVRPAFVQPNAPAAGPRPGMPPQPAVLQPAAARPAFVQPNAPAAGPRPGMPPQPAAASQPAAARPAFVQQNAPAAGPRPGMPPQPAAAPQPPVAAPRPAMVQPPAAAAAPRPAMVQQPGGTSVGPRPMAPQPQPPAAAPRPAVVQPPAAVVRPAYTQQPGGTSVGPRPMAPQPQPPQPAAPRPAVVQPPAAVVRPAYTQQQAGNPGGTRQMPPQPAPRPAVVQPPAAAPRPTIPQRSQYAGVPMRPGMPPKKPE